MKKMRLFLSVCLTVLLLMPAAVMAQRGKAPEWVNYDKRARLFPEQKFVMGFSSDKTRPGTTRSDLVDQLEDDSRTALVEAIQVSIRSMATSNIVATQSETYNTFRRTSVSMSKIDLKGLKVENYIDDENGEAFAIAYANKAEISTLYRNKIQSEKARIEQYVNNAKQFVASGDNQNALKSFYTAMPLFREIEEAQTLIMTFEGVDASAPHLFFDEVNKLKVEIAEGIKILQSGNNLSIDDAAFAIALGLKMQADSLDKEVRLTNFTFQDTKMASTFSKRFTRSLEAKLLANNLNVTVHEAKMDDNNADKNYYTLVGTYWEEGDNIKMIANVRDAASGRTVASAEATLTKKWLADNSLEFKPANYDNALKSLIQFNQENIPEGGLLIEVATNKGNEGLIFTEDEEMKLYVRVNKACYLRFIYHMADGTQVLLFDSYYIGNDKANQVIEIPETFVCAAPFGVETLQVNAQTQEFPPLRLRHEYGYSFIEEELSDVLVKTRGFKPKANKDAKTEKRVVITTVAK